MMARMVLQEEESKKCNIKYLRDFVFVARVCCDFVFGLQVGPIQCWFIGVIQYMNQV